MTGKKREINVLKPGTTSIYMKTTLMVHIIDAKSVTMNMEDVYPLNGLLTGIEGKVDEMLVSRTMIYWLYHFHAKEVSRYPDVEIRGVFAA